MIKAIFLLLMSLPLFANEEHALISVQRWNKKIVVSIHHDEGWHTYWKNPGDAGIASSFKFSRETKSFEWPSPKKYIEAGDILTIGYSDLKHFFFEDIVGDFDVKVGVLICKDICIPGEAILKLSANDQFASNRRREPYASSELEKAFLELPASISNPKDLEYYLTREKDQPKLTLHYSFKNIKDPTLPRELNPLTGFPQAPWGFKRESLYFKDGVLFGKTEIEWDGEYQDPPVELPKDGQFTTPYQLQFLINAPGTKKPEVVTLKIENFSIATPTLNDFYKNMSALSGKVASTAQVKTSGNIFEFLLFAFLGGLILNLMPCVLPVISLKLFGLIKHQNLPQKKLLKHNLTYTAGVLSTLIGLGIIVVGIKSSGEEIGWGFQLQSPAFLLVMVILLFILSLNLFGLFEFKTPGGSKLGSTELSEGFTGDFLSGVLTTILSTPCSAPFLGTALAFAFTTSTLNIFLIFIFIGLGLSFPFLMTAIFPRSLHILPRPGAWMEKLKYFLGLTLLVTVIWLYDVYLSLVNAETMTFMVNLVLILWFFAFFSARKIFPNSKLRFFIFLMPIIFTIGAIKNLELKPVSSSQTTQEVPERWDSWSEEKLMAKKGEFVFVDFTAEWCLTCKVNKKLVLDTDAFLELTKKYNVTLLRADWTKRDDNITQFLKRYNIVGVPAYFIQKPSGEIISLGETITLGKIEGHLN